MKDKPKGKPPQRDEPELTFEEAMRKIVHTPKEKVDEAIERDKKKPRGNPTKNKGQ